MVETICAGCGKKIRVYPSQLRRSKENFCSRACHMAKLNAELNPTRMTEDVRSKLSLSRRGSGEGRTYEKTNGRHVHRQIAEKMLGRKLQPGEVVHHINGNKRDNRPENLMVFSCQGDHTRWHAQHRKGVMQDEVRRT